MPRISPDAGGFRGKPQGVVDDTIAAHGPELQPRPRLARPRVQQPRPGARPPVVLSALGPGLAAGAPAGWGAGRRALRSRAAGAARHLPGPGWGGRRAGAVLHPWRLLARARQVRPFLPGAAVPAPGGVRGGGQLRAGAGHHHPGHHAADGAGTGLDAPPHRRTRRRPEPHHRGGPFGGRAPGGHDAGLPLARGGRRSAGLAGAQRAVDLGGVRSGAGAPGALRATLAPAHARSGAQGQPGATALTGSAPGAR